MHHLSGRSLSSRGVTTFFGSGVLAIAALGAATVAACGDDTGSGSTGDTTTTSSAGGGGTGGAGGGTTTVGTGGGGGMGTGGSGGCMDSLPVITVAPALLSDTGLYSDIETDTVATHARAFQPKYPLWTDDAAKRRWAYLPECGGPIDTTTMDLWSMPVGARFWKEFTRDAIRIETRMIVRTGAGPDEFLYATYVWNGTNDDATLTTDGVTNAFGTGHDVPPVALCTFCHTAGWRVLGFSAIQLSHSLAGETIASLSAEGKLSTPAPAGFPAPGSATAQAALGYLHANCGNCHHPGGSVPQVNMALNLRTTDATVAGTNAFTTAVNQPTTGYACGASMTVGGCDRIEPSTPDTSAIYLRMGSRPGPPTPPAPFKTTGQMPPVGTELADTNGGLAAVAAWINEPPQ